MVVLNGIKNLLQFINESWTVIVVIIGLGIALYRKIVDYMSKSNDEKIEIAKTQISETILKLISDAEEDYDEWVSAGSIKRAQVIEKIYASYPILSKVVDQTALTEWIDEQIDSALDTLREIIEQNTSETVAKSDCGEIGGWTISEDSVTEETE